MKTENTKEIPPMLCRQKIKLAFISAAILLVGCANTPKISDKEALMYGKDGALGMLTADSDLYREATFAENNTLTETLYKNTLTKVEILKRFETEIGGNYKIEDDIRAVNMNQLCWIGNFLIAHKKYSTEADQELLKWVEAKQDIYKTNINESFGSKKIKNDCRS